MIINAGIRWIYFQNGYADQLASEILREAGVEVVRV
jgi:deoxycytidylate deaminase